MKHLADLILDLQHATDSDRTLDLHIGLLLGYKRSVSVKLSADGIEERHVTWTFQTESTASRVPYFTGNLDAAIKLANTILPKCAAAVSWEPRGSAAKIDDGPSFYGATPPLALCVAALSAKHQIDSTRPVE